MAAGAVQPGAGIHSQGEAGQASTPVRAAGDTAAAVAARGQPPAGAAAGLLYLRRTVAEGREVPSLLGTPLPGLAGLFERKHYEEGWAGGAVERRALRGATLREAGGLTYDHVEGELRRLGWRPAATLKDLHHLFGTGLANAGVPEPYRQYLMGQVPSTAAIAAYSHLDKVREHYLVAVEREWAPLVAVLTARTRGTAAAADNGRGAISAAHRDHGPGRSRTCLRCLARCRIGSMCRGRSAGGGNNVGEKETGHGLGGVPLRSSGKSFVIAGRSLRAGGRHGRGFRPG